jgi:hypothetical protein
VVDREKFRHGLHAHRCDLLRNRELRERRLDLLNTNMNLRELLYESLLTVMSRFDAWHEYQPSFLMTLGKAKQPARAQKAKVAALKRYRNRSALLTCSYGPMVVLRIGVDER